jgi:hypothetical protein
MWCCQDVTSDVRDFKAAQSRTLNSDKLLRLCNPKIGKKKDLMSEHPSLESIFVKKNYTYKYLSFPQNSSSAFLKLGSPSSLATYAIRRN